MKNGWSAGQYGVFRVVFGLYLLQHFIRLLPWGTEVFSSAGVLPRASLSPLIYLFPNVFLFWDSPLSVALLLAASAVFCSFFVIGKYDRLMALLIWYLWACLYGRNPMIGNPALPFIGWLLLAHALIPSRPDKKQRLATEGDADSWRLPSDIYLASWILMAVAYSYSGYTKLLSPSWLDGSALTRVLSNPLARDSFLRPLLLASPSWFLKTATWSALTLELSFAPLALIRRVRPWLWLAMVGLHAGLLILVNFSDLTAGMLILHFFTFDPAWIPSPKPNGQPIFYDGHCALCHGVVRFALYEDRSEQPFQFAPLQGGLAHRTLPESMCGGAPASVVVLDEKRNVLLRSVAVIHVMKRLGGLWFLMATVLSFVPRALRDFSYSTVASFRKAVLGEAEALCPIVPGTLRARLRD